MTASDRNSLPRALAVALLSGLAFLLTDYLHVARAWQISIILGVVLAAQWALTWRHNKQKYKWTVWSVLGVILVLVLFAGFTYYDLVGESTMSSPFWTIACALVLLLLLFGMFTTSWLQYRKEAGLSKPKQQEKPSMGESTTQNTKAS